MFMSSGHWTNTGMAKFINDNLYNYKSDDEKSMNPFRWYRLQNGEDVSKYRETINGFPCRLILINDGETPLNEGQNEPTPGNTKDMGIFNFNNDKDNVTTLGFNSDIFPNCASYEVTANSDTSAGAFMSYTGGKDVIQADYYIQSSDQQKISGFIPISVFKGQPIINTNAIYKSLIFYDENLNQIGSNGSSATYKVPDGTIYFSIGWFTVDFVLSGIIFRPGNQMSGLGVATLTYPNYNEADELAYLKESFELRHPDEDDVAEDWGYMGTGLYIDCYQFPADIGVNKTRTCLFKKGNTIPQVRTDMSNTVSIEGYSDNGQWTSNVSQAYYISVNIIGDWNIIYIDDVAYNKGVIYEGVQGKDSEYIKEPYSDGGLKALIDWVDNCTDEEFVADFEQHFHKDYTLRYFCLVTLIGAVDNLG